MQRFTYAEPRDTTEVEPQENLVLCMGACNTSVPESRGKLINNEFYCDDCRICVCCGEPAIMDDGNGLVCSPSRLLPVFDSVGDFTRVAGDLVVCNGSLQDAEEADEAAKDQLDWDNRAYRG